MLRGTSSAARSISSSIGIIKPSQLRSSEDLAHKLNSQQKLIEHALSKTHFAHAPPLICCFNSVFLLLPYWTKKVKLLPTAGFYFARLHRGGGHKHRGCLLGRPPSVGQEHTRESNTHVTPPGRMDERVLYHVHTQEKGGVLHVFL